MALPSKKSNYGTTENAVLILILVVIAVLSGLTILKYGGITGLAAQSPEVVLTDIKELAATDAVKFLGDNAIICIRIQMDTDNIYSYEITKNSASIVQSCNQNSIIVKFLSYYVFKKFKTDPLQEYLTNKNINFFAEQSNYFSPALGVVCSDEFKANYCGLGYFYFTKDEMKRLGIDCCADYVLTAGQQGIAKEKQVEQATYVQSITVKSNMWMWVSGAAIMIVLGGFVGVLTLRKKPAAQPQQKFQPAQQAFAPQPVNPELARYVQQSLAQGLTQEQIRQSLLNVGWDENSVNGALNQRIFS